MSSDSYERETVNNQKRIIRELKRIGDALERIADADAWKKQDHTTLKEAWDLYNTRMALADYVSNDNDKEKTEEE